VNSYLILVKGAWKIVRGWDEAEKFLRDWLATNPGPPMNVSIFKRLAGGNLMPVDLDPMVAWVQAGNRLPGSPEPS
jgi:hypothetical protein